MYETAKGKIIFFDYTAMFQRVFEQIIFAILSNEYFRITLENNTFILVTVPEKYPQYKVSPLFLSWASE